ncbi:MAG: hypothetical protein XD95_0528 [Microgenomates bacterium 39_7]|nr:MAG: hypothetical protein XD95_0528 [Microgenomates bacterium 39_7]
MNVMYTIGCGMNMKRTQLYLTKEQLDWLKKIAKKQGTSIAEINRRAIDACISQPEKVEKNKVKPLTLGESMRQIAELAKKEKFKGPKDLASNVDKYLYHD